ncbi:MAG TPA: glutathione S-transferase N-terminal domain-containing protein [Nitrospiria bacterium]|nr:glutathione S-transferase N-terminal domain-containing protein [Nitrospiria bacterium]
MLELYQLEDCPYCVRVREALADLGLDYIIRNEPSSHRERTRVRALSGQTFVPTLHDPERGIVIADDDDKIIAYLHEHYGRRAV